MTLVPFLDLRYVQVRSINRLLVLHKFQLVLSRFEPRRAFSKRQNIVGGATLERHPSAILNMVNVVTVTIAFLSLVYPVITHTSLVQGGTVSRVRIQAINI